VASATASAAFWLSLHALPRVLTTCTEQLTIDCQGLAFYRSRSVQRKTRVGQRKTCQRKTFIINADLRNSCQGYALRNPVNVT
jgi:hypothetical protein